MRLHVPSLPVARFLFAVLSSPMLVKESLAQGGHATFGFGTGSGTIMCTACSNAGNVGGSTALIQVGGPATPHLQVGFSADWWWHDFSSPQPAEEGIFDLAVSVFYYPSAERHRFFIEGGPALSEAYATVNDSAALQRHGWGFTAGIGYDVAPRWVVSLTPRLAYSYAWVGDINYPLGSNVPFARGWKHEVVSLSLGLTFHERRARGR